MKANSTHINEYRTVIFTMDNENVMLATKIILLNAFLKKSTKDYKKQIKSLFKFSSFKFLSAPF